MGRAIPEGYKRERQIILGSNITEAIGLGDTVDVTRRADDGSEVKSGTAAALFAASLRFEVDPDIDEDEAAK